MSDRNKIGNETVQTLFCVTRNANKCSSVSQSVVGWCSIQFGFIDVTRRDALNSLSDQISMHLTAIISHSVSVDFSNRQTQTRIGCLSLMMCTRRYSTTVFFFSKSTVNKLVRRSYVVAEIVDELSWTKKNIKNDKKEFPRNIWNANIYKGTCAKPHGHTSYFCSIIIFVVFSLGFGCFGSSRHTSSIQQGLLWSVESRRMPSKSIGENIGNECSLLSFVSQLFIIYYFRTLSLSLSLLLDVAVVVVLM